MNLLKKSFLILALCIAMTAVASCSDSSKKSKTDDTKAKNTSTTQARESSSEFLWSQAGDVSVGFIAQGTPPDCPEQPILKSPIDLAQVNSILYPGQTRGGNYKAHGGFRLNSEHAQDSKVTAPIDGFVFRGSRYIEMGEVQYLFDVMNNCGIMFRLDHLRVLSPELQKIADGWPEPKENASQTNQVVPAVHIEQGATIATAVGFELMSNISFDFGVYDFRSSNESSKSESYKQTHQESGETAFHGVCWFDWLPATDAATVKSLPAGDSANGKTSDYCE